MADASAIFGSAHARRLRTRDGGLQVGAHTVSGVGSVAVDRAVGNLSGFELKGYSSQAQVPNFTNHSPVLNAQNIDIICEAGEPTTLYNIDMLMRSIPNGAADTFLLNRDDRTIIVYQNIAEITLSETYYVSNADGICLFEMPYAAKKLATDDSLGYSNYYPCYSVDYEGETGFCSYGLDDFYLYFDRAAMGVADDDDDDVSLSKINAWLAQKQLAGKPMTLTYQLSRPVVHTLTYADFPANNGIYKTNSDMPLPLKATYTRLGA